jgi:hypothetical protein
LVHRIHVADEAAQPALHKVLGFWGHVCWENSDWLARARRGDLRIARRPFRPDRGVRTGPPSGEPNMGVTERWPLLVNRVAKCNRRQGRDEAS